MKMKEKSKSRVGIWNGVMNIVKYLVINDLDVCYKFRFEFFGSRIKMWRFLVVIIFVINYFVFLFFID